MPLKNITTILSGTYQKEFQNGDLLYLQVKDFTDENISKKRIKPTIIKDKKTEKYILHDKDLLFAAKGFSNFCVLYRQDWGEAVASTVFFVLRIINDMILPEYLCWYINTPQIMKQLQAKAKGSAIPSITKETLMEFEVNIPPLKTQRAILNCAELQEKAFSIQQKIVQKKQLLNTQLLLNATK